jgi:hypothetical protein
MPGIDVHADNEPLKEKLLLFYDEETVQSELQKIVLEEMDTDVIVEMHTPKEREDLISKYSISRTPTTLFLNEFGVLNRWPGLTHEEEILPTLDDYT